MLEFADKYGYKGSYSQFGEQGILDEALRRINPKVKVAVEFGGADGYYCSNTRHLAEKGWTIHMYDIHPKSDLVEEKMITMYNINDLPACSVLSMDTDGPDFFLFLAYQQRPHIIIIEINSSLLPMDDFVSTTKGANYSAMLQLALSKGYFLLCHTGNFVLIRDLHRHLFPEIQGNGLSNWPLYLNTSHLPR